jgi:hypothetical protein
MVAAVEASGAAPPPVPAATAEEGQTTTGVTAPQAALEPPAEASSSSGYVVVVLDEDSAPPPSSEGRDVVMALVSEPAPVLATAGPLPVVEVSEPSPAAEVPGPSPTAEVAETSSARGTITVEEVMELATCRYIDSPGVGVIDLEEPQLPEKALEVATERMFVESSIMETITSVSKVLHEYERAGGFGTEPAADAFVPPPTSESREASLPQPAEVAETTTAVAVTGIAQVIVREAGSSPSRPVAAEVFKVRVPDEPAVTVQK